MTKIFIGTSGFTYQHWREVFYPPDLRQKDWLGYYANYFDTVEINASFYHQMSKKVYEGWAKRTPKDFLFAVKGSRFITHVKRLKDCQETLKRFFDSVSGLGEKLGVVLWQLPPKWKADKKRLEEFLRAISLFSTALRSPTSDFFGFRFSREESFDSDQAPSRSQGKRSKIERAPRASYPRPFRHAFEFRDQSWLSPQVYALLKEYSAALVIQDSPSWPKAEIITSNFTYLRFHGRESLYGSCYNKEQLKGWAEKINRWQRANLGGYAFFNNDACGYAIKNAQELKELLHC